MKTKDEIDVEWNVYITSAQRNKIVHCLKNVNV
jgi:hypothetical protein